MLKPALRLHAESYAQINVTMKTSILVLIFFAILTFPCCHQKGKNVNNDRVDSIAAIVNRTVYCFELTGTLPNMTIFSNKYFGKIFLQPHYDSTKKEFNKYFVVRSTLYNKADSSVYDNYQSDSKIPLPAIYKQIIEEIRFRINTSKIGLKRINFSDSCFSNDWITLPILIK